MANTKYYPDGYSLTMWWATDNAFANPSNPTAAELNNSENVTCAVAWDSYGFGSNASSQNSDPTWCDVGNTQTRGFADFGGAISFVYPANYTDVTNPLVRAFLALKEPWTIGYLVIRIDGKKTTGGAGDVDKPAVNGDFVRVYRVMSDGWQDAVTGELSFKYAVTFTPQGQVYVNAPVGPVTLTAPAPIGAADYTIAGRTPLSGYRTGRQLAAVTGEWSGTPGWFRWLSSDPNVASVDRNGVVTGVSAGTASITYVDDLANVTSPALEVTVA